MKRFLLALAVTLLVTAWSGAPAVANNGNPPSCPIHDSGPSWHARGPLNGNIYTVHFGDTLFSIGQRFGVSVNNLAAANGISNTSLIYAWQRLTIPCNGPGSGTLQITAPTSGSTLPATFTVSGTASGLPAGSQVTVQAQTSNGTVLASQTTTLSGSNPGTWSVQLTVNNVASGTAGYLVAMAAGAPQVSVPVIYGSGSPSAALQITSPTPGSTLPATFTVTGTATGLPAGTQVVVQAQQTNGTVLASQTTTLSGSNPGTWSVQLTVNNVANGTPGNVVATSPGASQASVPVIYGSAPPPAALQITTPAPNSTVPATFTVNGTATGLPAGTQVVVQAQTSNGMTIAQQLVTLSGSNPSAWSVQMTVNVPNGTQGNVVAFGGGAALVSVPVTYTGPPPPLTVLQVTTPAPGSAVPASFPVSGTALGLPGGSQVTVQAQTSTGTVLDSETATLPGSAPGVPVNWSVQMTVNVPNGTPGNVVATSPGATPVTVPVVYGGTSPQYKAYTPGQCPIQVPPGTPTYLYPNGPTTGQFSGTTNALASTRPGGQLWYLLPPAPTANNLPAWVNSGTVTDNPGCAW